MNPIILLCVGALTGGIIAATFIGLIPNERINLLGSTTGAMAGAAFTTLGAFFVAYYSITQPKREAIKTVRRQILHCKILSSDIKNSDQKIIDLVVSYLGGHNQEVTADKRPNIESVLVAAENSARDNSRYLRELKLTLEDTVESFGLYFPPILRNRLRDSHKTVSSIISCNSTFLKTAELARLRYLNHNDYPSKNDLDVFYQGSGAMAYLIFQFDADIEDALQACDANNTKKF